MSRVDAGTGSPPKVTSVYRTPSQAPACELFAGIVGYELSGFPAGTHVGLPGRSLTLMVPFESAVVVSGEAMDGSGRPLREPTPFTGLIGGMHDLPVLIHHDGFQAGVQVDLTPAGSRALFGMPAAELAGQVLSLADVLGPGAEQLADRLATSPDWQTRVAVVEQGLSRQLARGVESLERTSQRDPATWHAWRLLTSSDGALPVAQVARQVGWSRRAVDRTVQRRVRPPTEGRGPGDAVRTCASSVAAGAHSEARGGGHRLRLRRPGSSHPRMAQAGRLHADPVADRRGLSPSAGSRSSRRVFPNIQDRYAHGPPALIA